MMPYQMLSAQNREGLSRQIEMISPEEILWVIISAGVLILCLWTANWLERRRQRKEFEEWIDHYYRNLDEE